MKKLLVTVLCAAATLTASAQGTLTFLNGTAPVFNTDGETGLGAGFTAQLQLADGTNVGDPANFVQNGIFSGGDLIIPGVAGPGPVDLKVFVTNEDGMLQGTSAVFAQALGGHGSPPATPAALAMGSFSVQVIPEPSHIALALLGGAALLLKRRKK